jgi:hypothetical protein
MIDSAPQGAVLRKTKKVLWWRDCYFHLENEPSKESRLKRGDTLILSVACRF